jgi:hypothetical protein
MLELFRKYQRILFIFVTVIIIVTFSLFGSYKTLGQMEKRKEIVVGHAIDGSKLKYFEIKQLGALLGAEPPSTGVFGQDLLKTGVAERLAASFDEGLKPDWRARLDRLKRCRFYVHPAAPFLSAEQIWNKLAPGALEEIHHLQGMEEVNSEFFAGWARLFWLQEKCPPELVKRILLYHQNQYHLPNDPRILSEDFSLCSFRSAQEWFGANFTDLACQMILNGAIEAEAKGFQATVAEAEADLMQRFSFKGANLDLVLRSLGVRKSDAVQLWQRVLVFLRYFHATGQAVLVDDLPYRQLADFAGQSAVIDVFQLPKELQFHSLDDFLVFEIYSRLACSPFDFASLPFELLSPETVAKNAPELVATKFQINCAQIDLAAIQARLSMREVWDWQMEPAHWEAINAAFPEMASISGKNRFQILEKLDPERRAHIDDWSRRQMVESHPEWIEQEWAAAQFQERDAVFYENGDIDGLSIQNGAVFRGWIDGFGVQDPQAVESLKSFREGQTIWRIADVQKKNEKSVLSLADAKAKGRIRIDSYLEDQYLFLRCQTPSLFQDSHGDWKPFGEVKEVVIRQVFAPLFRWIDSETGCVDGTKPLSFYASHRFCGLMKMVRLSMQANTAAGPSGLWPIEKSERTIARTSSEDWIMKQPFILKTGEWSDVYVPPNGEIVFFFVKDRAQIDGPILDQIQHGKETLSSDAQCYLADQLIANALKKQAIVFPLKTTTEKNDDL